MGNVGSDGRPYSHAEQERLARALFSLTQALFVEPWQPLTERRLLAWHAELSGGVLRMQPGRWRTQAITFGSYFGSAPESIPGQVRRALRLLYVRLIHAQAGTEAQDALAVYRAAVWLHADLVRIHPVWDGNGRLARLAQNTLLFAHDLNPAEYHDRTRYFSALGAYLRRDDVEPLLALTLAGLIRDA